MLFRSVSQSRYETHREIGSSYSFQSSLTLDRGDVRGALVGGVWNTGASQGSRSGTAVNYNIEGQNLGLVNSRILSGVAVLGDNVFSGSIEYSASTVQPTDSTEQPFDTPLIGGVVSDTNKFVGKYRLFYGPVPFGTPLTRSALEPILLSELINGPVNFEFQTGTIQRTWIIAMPSNRSFDVNDGVRNFTALNQLITPSFKLQEVTQLADPSGTMRNYKIYLMTNDEAYQFNQLFKVKLV